MVNKEANIDLLFRNGLKDYEVLPPVEVWNNILPFVRKRQKPVILLRSAALITVLLSLSFLTYRWSREISTSLRNPTLAVNEESAQVQDNTKNFGNSRKVPVTNKLNREVIKNDLDSDQPGVAELSDGGNIDPSGLTITISGPLQSLRHFLVSAIILKTSMLVIKVLIRLIMRSKK
jgi:hypothetical protein